MPVSPPASPAGASIFVQIPPRVSHWDVRWVNRRAPLRYVTTGTIQNLAWMSRGTERSRDAVDYSEVAPTKASHPTRTCVGCREKGDRSELLRVVVDGTDLVPDTAARLPGRGAWVHRNLDCLALAVRRRAFPRALRVPGPLVEDAVQVFIESCTSKK